MSRAEQMRAATGWPIRFAPQVEQTPPPTATELRVLRDLQERTARTWDGPRMNDPRTALWSTPEMLGLFSAEAHLAAILRFEAALARAEARAGVIPEATDAIAAASRGDRFDVAQVFRAVATAGTVVLPWSDS